MKAVVFHGIGDIRLDDVKEPKIEEQTDAIVRLTASAICGTDLHFVRGTVTPMVEGTILGHEGVGVVEEVGKDVRNFRKGDRVVVPSTIACGYCAYCRAGYYAQCDHANPNGASAGTAFYGGPKSSGPFHGMQAEFVRVPYAAVNLVKLPEEVTDDQAIMLSDIFPTAYFGAELAEIDDGDTVAVWGGVVVGYVYFNRLGSANLLATNFPQITRAAITQTAPSASNPLCAGEGFAGCFRATQQGYPSGLPNNVTTKAVVRGFLFREMAA